MKKSRFYLVFILLILLCFHSCQSTQNCTSFSEAIQYSKQTDWAFNFSITFNPDSSFVCSYQTPIGLFKSNGVYRKCQNEIQFKYPGVYSYPPNRPKFPKGFTLKNDTLWSEGNEFKKLFPFLTKED